VKILVIDIETAPGERYYWSLFDDYGTIDQIIRPPRLLCWAAKWHGSRQVEFMSEWDHGTGPMVARAGELLSEADAVVHYFGKRFDVPHINREMILAGIPPPMPHKDIDLKQVVAKRFKFSSNKLDHVASELGLGNKVEHEGFKLWRKIVDPEVSERARLLAQRRMRRYNIGDVLLTERLYDRVKPWIPNHPNVALYDGIEGGCPNCGSTDMIKDGFRYTTIGKFQRFRCKGCGAPVTSGKRIEGVDLRPAV
jgi:hypothetical protein